MAVSFIGGETGVPGENNRTAAGYWQTVSHNVYRVHLARVGFELTMLVVIATDCIDSCKSNYHTITTTTARTMKYTQKLTRIIQRPLSTVATRLIDFVPIVHSFGVLPVDGKNRWMHSGVNVATSGSVT